MHLTSNTFVVGDVHGCRAQLQALVSELEPHARAGDSLILLGDLIDRGPETRGVLDLLLELQRGAWPGPVVALTGNHEAVLTYVLERGHLRVFREWLTAFAGEAMVANYTDERTLQSFRDSLPVEHCLLLQDLPAWHEDRHGIYVHAGVPTGWHPRDCRPEELLWHTNDGYTFGKPVVYGHQPVPEGWPRARPHAIALDTGCGFGGPLTAIRLPDRRVFQAFP